MTGDEYACFVEEPAVLRFILESRRLGLSPSEVMRRAAQDGPAVEGQRFDPREIEAVRKWLERTGRVHSKA